MNDTKTPSPDVTTNSAQPELSQPQRSMIRRVLGELLLFWSARVGLVWIGFVLLCAVFAPLLANSHPLLMQTAETELDHLTRYEPGQWASPMLRHLSVPDVLLPLLFFGALVAVLWRGGVGLGQRLGVSLGSLGLLLMLSLWANHFGPFMLEGHEGWWQALLDWREGVEPVPGFPAELPLGEIIWWAVRWAGLVLFLVLAAGALGVVGLSVWGIAPGLVRMTGAGLLALVVAGIWIALVMWLGVWGWLIGLLAVLVKVGVVIAWRAWGFPLLALVLIGGSMVAGGWMVHSPVEPPRLTIYEQYREAEEAGEIEWTLYAPIPYSPDDRLRDQRGMRFQPPSADHWMGTTRLSADLASNMLHGTRIALSVGFISTGIAIVIGIFIGGLMGYFSGVFDLLGMRLVEMFSAIPTLFLLLAFVAAFGGGEATLYLIMVIIGLTEWKGHALFIRAEFLRLRQQEFVQAAEALGMPLLGILGRHLLPNGVAPLLVAASFGVAGAIGYEATLSFIGIGLDTEQSWGLLLDQARAGGGLNWWIALYPGLAIFLTVFAYILVGESLRDAIDPRTHKRSQ